jgi:hypothetical protein
MPYSKGTNLPGQYASKLGHLAVIQSEWVKELVSEFEFAQPITENLSHTIWLEFDSTGIEPLRNVWAVDGSYVSIQSEGVPPREVAFVKTALLTIDQVKLNKIDKENPHPLLLQDILTESAIFHATVFPLKNIRTNLGNNYDAVRYIVRDSMKVDEDGAFYETLKWLVYRKWSESPTSSPAFECPHCHSIIEQGLSFNQDEGICEKCQGTIFLTDMIGFHLDMDEDSAPDSVASAYMLVMENLMLFTAIRLLWHHMDKSILSETLFIKDGPLSLNKQYSKLVPSIRTFLQYAKDSKRPVHVIGQEKSGAFFDYLRSIVRFASPFERGEKPSYAVLTHDYIRQEVHRSPNRANPYGSRTNWGEKMFLKIDPGTYMVLNVTTGNYDPAGDSPRECSLIGLPRILATIPSLVSHKFEGALFPVELADGIASMSNYPSAKILQRFTDSNSKQ